MSAIEVVTRPIPAWIHDIEFCHIAEEHGTGVFCGATDVEGWCPGKYDGEAICPSCGFPTCPRCAQLSDLDDRAEEAA